jgi:YggT family protein
VEIVKIVLTYVLTLYLLLLIGRLIFSWIQALSRPTPGEERWRPRGPLLVVAEAVYTPTDPPLKFLSKLLPPVRLGRVALDLSYLVLFFAVWLLLIYVVPLL